MLKDEKVDNEKFMNVVVAQKNLMKYNYCKIVYVSYARLFLINFNIIHISKSYKMPYY